jgi:hypothetical protein
VIEAQSAVGPRFWAFLKLRTRQSSAICTTWHDLCDWRRWSRMGSSHQRSFQFQFSYNLDKGFRSWLWPARWWFYLTRMQPRDVDQFRSNGGEFKRLPSIASATNNNLLQSARNSPMPFRKLDLVF